MIFISSPEPSFCVVPLAPKRVGTTLQRPAAVVERSGITVDGRRISLLRVQPEMPSFALNDVDGC